MTRLRKGEVLRVRLAELGCRTLDRGLDRKPGIWRSWYGPLALIGLGVWFWVVVWAVVRSW